MRPEANGRYTRPKSRGGIPPRSRGGELTMRHHRCATGGDETLDSLVDGLQRLEYRGYDSAGMLAQSNRLSKRSARSPTSRGRSSTPLGRYGIGHTRWATHGGVTDGNAHPHTDESGRIAVVHNGIISNFQSLRDDLVGAGHTFTSDTDTEVVPHLIEDASEAGADPEDAVREAISRLDGSYAVAVVVAGVTRCSPRATTRRSSLVSMTARPTWRATCPHSGTSPTRSSTSPTGSSPASTATAGPSRHRRHRHREGRRHRSVGPRGDRQERLRPLHAQGNPRATARAPAVPAWPRRRTRRDGRHRRPRGPLPDRRPVRRRGTSYHAALHGAQLFREAGIPAQAFLASEYATATPPIGDASVVGVTRAAIPQTRSRRSGRPAAAVHARWP